MTTLLLILAAGALAAPGGDVALEPVQSSPPERIELPVVTPGCGPRSDKPDEVVVCGSGEERFRIDPSTLSVMRSRGAMRTDPTLGRARLFKEACNPVGPMAACQSDTLPVLPMAVKAVTMIGKALKGEDLKPMLRPESTEYERYQAAEAERQERGE